MNKDIYESPYSPTIMGATFPSSDPTKIGYQIGNLYLPFLPLYNFTGVDENNVRRL